MINVSFVRGEVDGREPSSDLWNRQNCPFATGASFPTRGLDVDMELASADIIHRGCEL